MSLPSISKSLLALTLLSGALVCSCASPLLTTSADRSHERSPNASESTTPATQVFSRWTVKAGSDDDFISVWAATMRQNLTVEKNFRGSFLLRSQKDRNQFLAVELWTNVESWQAFKTSSSASSSLQSMSSSQSSEAFDQIFDRLDSSEWKRKLVRIYGLRVTDRGAFIDTWLKVNVSIGAKVSGARGGLLLNDRADRSMFYEVVRWDSLDAWQKFIAAPPADPESFQKIFSLMSVTSAESFDEIDFVTR